MGMDDELDVFIEFQAIKIFYRYDRVIFSRDNGCGGVNIFDGGSHHRIGLEVLLRRLEIAVALKQRVGDRLNRFQVQDILKIIEIRK